MLDPRAVTDELRARVRAELPRSGRSATLSSPPRSSRPGRWRSPAAASVRSPRSSLPATRASTRSSAAARPTTSAASRAWPWPWPISCRRCCRTLNRPRPLDRGRALPRHRQALGVRPGEPPSVGGQAAPCRPAVDPPPGFWRACLPFRRPAGGGCALRRGPFGRGRASGALAREHDRPSRRLRLLGHLPRGRPVGAWQHRRELKVRH